MTSHDLWKRPEFIIGETYDLSVSMRQATFRLEATRSGAGVTTQAEFTCVTKLIYGKRDEFREPVRLTVEATLPRDPDNNDPFPLGMLFVEDPIGEAMLYIAQSETIVTHLARVAQGDTELRFGFVGRAVETGQLEIIDFTAAYG